MTISSKPALPQITEISSDRLTISIAGAIAGCAITITFMGADVSFTRARDEPAQLERLTMNEPLGAWEALGGFTEVQVDGLRVGVAHDVIRAERARVRLLISQQTTASQAATMTSVAASKHGIVPPAGIRTEAVESPVPLPVGSLSKDGSAVVGNGGHLFIRDGSNSLLARYATPRNDEQIAAVDREVRAWSDVTDRRRERLRELGTDFLQVCIPDKSTMLNSGVPGLGPVTPTLRQVELELGTMPEYLSAREALSNGKQTEVGVTENWLRLDSHTSPRGSWQLSAAMVAAFGDATFMWDVDFSAQSTYSGDLGRRFFGVSIPEPIEAPLGDWLSAADEDRQLIDRHAPASGHAGRMLHWKSPNAPIDAKVLVFGNSFFGAGDISMSCNYWVSRAFQEHKFIWSADMLVDVVRTERPDLVICQTVERFMGEIPAN